MASRRLRRALVVLTTAFASITMVGVTGASANCSTTYIGGETSVCATGPASVWNIGSIGFCGDLCYEVHSQPSVHTGGEVSVTVLDDRIVTVNVPEEDVYLGTFCYTTAGGSC
jgi:hypothetical protein